MSLAGSTSEIRHALSVLQKSLLSRSPLEATLMRHSATEFKKCHSMPKLWSMPLRERRGITGLPKKRADVILPGLAIYEAVLQEFGFSELRASTRGLRFAAVLQPGPGR